MSAAAAPNRGLVDHAGRVSRGRTAHEAIAGSTHAECLDVGHLPMQKNPLAFARYLQPVLDRIRGAE